LLSILAMEPIGISGCAARRKAEKAIANGCPVW
jgi:hypothetical protein